MSRMVRFQVAFAIICFLLNSEMFASAPRMSVSSRVL